MCALGRGARPWGTLPFSSFFWSPAPGASTGKGLRQGPLHGGVKGLNGQWEPSRTQLLSHPWGWGRHEGEENVCVSSPVRSGGPGPPPDLPLPQDATILLTPPGVPFPSQSPWGSRGRGTAPEAPGSHVEGPARPPDSQPGASGLPCPLEGQM